MKRTIFNSQYYLFLILIIYFFYYFFQISEYYIFHENWNALKNVEENPIGAIKRLDYDGFTNYLKNIYVILINTSERIFFDYFYFPPNFHSFTQGRYLGYINGNITDILINKISDAKYVRLIGLISISLYLFSILHYLKKYMNRNESILFLILFSTLPFFSYKILNGTFFIINFFFLINFLLSAVAVEYFKKINLKNIFFQNVAFLALYFVFNLLFLFYFPTLSFMILFPAVIVIFYSHDNETTKKIFFLTFLFLFITIIVYLGLLNYIEYLLINNNYSHLVPQIPDHYDYNSLKLSSINFGRIYEKFIIFIKYTFGLWFIEGIFQNIFVMINIFIFIYYLIKIKFSFLKIALIFILLSLYTLPLIAKSHDASLLRDNIFANFFLILILVSFFSFLQDKYKNKKKFINFSTSLVLILIIYSNYNFSWKQFVQPNVMQIDHIQQQIKNQKEKIQNGISFYWTNYQNSKRKFDVFSVVGSNFLGNVPFVIKGSCWSICNKKEYSDLSFANIWPEKHLILYKDINILDEDLVHFNNDEILNLEGEDINKYFQKLKKEKESKVIIILDKKFFDNIF